MSLLSLLGLAALVGLLAAWLTVLLLVFRGRPDWHLQGFVNRNAHTLAAFANAHLLAHLPPPSRFFEQLGPDRFRREYLRQLRERTDAHVDDIMERRNSLSWGGLSAYARARVYTHVQRRLPYAVDNFVDQVHHDIDSIVNPRSLVQRYFDNAPAHAGQLFLSAFGADLRALLPLAALAGCAAGGLLSGVAAGAWQFGWVLAGAALAGSLVILCLLAMPARARVFWPLRAEGILFRRRHRYLRALAKRVANEALAWPSLAGEFMHGAQSARVRQMMRREVSGILDTTLFKATLQWLIGPEALVDIKHSAQEKALELMASTPVSVALQENCRAEVERSLLFAADQDHGKAYVALWQSTLSDAWKIIPPLLAICGFCAGYVGGLILLPG